MALRPNNGDPSNPGDRDTIFICHASPDDNDFVRWLGARLTGHGYKVWADLFELKGGNPFWSTIEEALRHRACKMIFVVSRSSVDRNRTGVLNELSVADSIKKQVEDDSFIIPVKIDDTAYAEFPIQIHRLNAIDFSKGWGPKFIELLDALGSGAGIKTDSDQAAEFEKWRATMVRTSTIVEEAPEQVVTNRVPVIKFPRTISFYEYDGDNTKIASAMSDTGIPHAMCGRLIISFAGMSAIQQHLPPAFTLKPRTHASFDEFINGLEDGTFAPSRDEAQKIAIALLRQQVERYLQLRGLKKFESSGASSFYFPEGLVPNDKVPYQAASGRKTNKNVVGRSERNQVYWHLAMKVNIVMGPPAVVRFKPYLCFSEDGKSAITEVKKTSAIRKRFCRNWWNPQWRQLQEAFCVFLADGHDSVEISLDGPEKLVLGSRQIELSAARRMPDDLKITDEPDEPEEPTDIDPDERDDYDDPDVEDAP